MKQLEMKHTMLILSSCSWSCCTLRKFIIRWLYPQCFPCSSLCYLSSFLPLKNKQQQQRKAYKGRSGGENASRNNFKYAEWLLPAAKKKKKKSDAVISAHSSKLKLLHCPFLSQYFSYSVSPSYPQNVFCQLLSLFSLSSYAHAFL